MTLVVSAVPFKVSQEGRAACTFAIAPEQASFNDEGGSGQVTVTTTANCAWSTTSNAAWITVTGNAHGSGNGTVSYSVSANNATAARVGTLVVAGRTLTVDQAGESTSPTSCTYSVTPAEFAPCVAGGTVTATLTTQPNCSWTASSGASWLTITSAQSGNASSVISIAFSSNYDAPRDGVVMVRWPTPTEGQNIHVEQAGCHYAVSKNSFSFTSAGGSGTFDVLQETEPNTCGGPLQDACVWTAKSNVSWITITTGMPSKGDNPVAFTIAANSGASRSGTITVRDKVVTITQAAP
jgi:hypothetical protein